MAPTPSGYLHRGNAYNFLLVWLITRHRNGRIWLRIDDLDQGRYRPHFLDAIFFDLEWLGLDWDEGPSGMAEACTYSQYRRMDMYRSALDILDENPLVFGCVCSRREIRLASTDGQYPGTCRHVPVQEGLIRRIWSEMGMGVLNGIGHPLQERAIQLCNREGLPSYPLACVIDDAHYDVDLIVRGDDLFTSSLSQSFLRQELKLKKEPFHIHHSLLLDSEGRKLSKSTKSVPISNLREGGMKVLSLWKDFADWRGWSQVPQSKEELCIIFKEEDEYANVEFIF